MSLAEAAGSWRVALRVACRSARRNRARSVLLLCLLLIPVYASSVLALTWHASFASPDWQASWQLGQADVVLDGEGLDQAIAGLPAGSRRVTRLEGDTVVRTGGGYATYPYASVDPSDPLLRGMYVRRAGRAPQGSGEVALSTRLAHTLGVRIGQTISAGMPPRELAVVGIVDLAHELRRGALLSPPGQPLSGSPRRAVLVDLPDSAADWEPPIIDGLSWQTRADTRPTPLEQATQAANLTLIVGFAGAQLALLVSAAFAVGARRSDASWPCWRPWVPATARWPAWWLPTGRCSARWPPRSGSDWDTAHGGPVAGCWSAWSITPWPRPACRYRT